jgi:biotin synthase-like enzyme
VQTGTHKEAVTGIKIAIIHRRHPEVKLEQTQVDTIQIKLLNAVDGTPLGRDTTAILVL